MKAKDIASIKKATRAFAKEMEEVEPFLNRKVIEEPRRRGDWARADTISTQVGRHHSEKLTAEGEAA